jgi:serine/threonine-protein kinase RsbW
MSGLTGNKQQLTLSAEVTALPEARAFIRSACQDLHIANETSYDILLAVDEALSNIIEHGYAGLEHGPITVAWRKEAQRLIVEITDSGHAFEPVQPEQPDIEAKLLDGRLGGLGLYLIYNIMDKISYQTTAVGNTLTMIKELGDNKN